MCILTWRFFCSRTGGAKSLRQSERSSESIDRDSFSRWRDRQYFGPRRWLENALREPWNSNSDGSLSDSNRAGSKGFASQSENVSQTPAFAEQNNPIWLSDELEYWPEVKGVKFVAIAAMYSELVAVGNNGMLYQWKWIEVEPYRNPEVSYRMPRTKSVCYFSYVNVVYSRMRIFSIRGRHHLAYWVKKLFALLHHQFGALFRQNLAKWQPGLMRQ